MDYPFATLSMDQNYRLLTQNFTQISHGNNQINPHLEISQVWIFSFSLSWFWNYFWFHYTTSKSSFLWSGIKLITFQMHLLWKWLDFIWYPKSLKQESLSTKWNFCFNKPWNIIVSIIQNLLGFRPKSYYQTFRSSTGEQLW